MRGLHDLEFHVCPMEDYASVTDPLYHWQLLDGQRVNEVRHEGSGQPPYPSPNPPTHHPPLPAPHQTLPVIWIYF